MVNVGKWIAKHRILILIVAVILLIPATLGYIGTRTNYDILSYLPGDLETMEGQEIMVDEFGMCGFSMIVVEDMDMKDVAALEKEVEAVPHVAGVLWYDDVADLSVPVDMLPDNIKEVFFNGDATMMIALLDSETSSDTSMEAIANIKKVVNKQCFVSGMTAVVNDIKDLVESEIMIYVVIAVVLSLIILLLTTTSFLIPFLFLISIGFGIIYNLGSNIMFGQISYITKALAAVLQLAVTMDYSIFLFGSYEENKLRFPEDRIRAMGHAISNTFRSIVGSSVTTVAGFIALCFMTYTLGMDLGLVMAKGVVFGVITCVTVLPSLILIFDKPIHKLSHRPLIRSTDRLSAFITKHYKVWVVIFIALIAPAVWGNAHVENYYDMVGSLPDDLDSKIANGELEDNFDMNTMHVILFDKNMSAKDKSEMLDQISDLDGVKSVISMSSLVSPTIPEDMIPDSIKDLLQSDTHELALVSSTYAVASDEVNAQVDQISSIVKSYNEDNMLIGEAPLTKDLMDITKVDFVNVNTVSIIAIFIIIVLVMKSISIPVILVAIIEFAIAANMSVPYYMGVKLPFIASIVLGCIQLGSTVDYAILMTTRYVKERSRGADKKTAVDIAHKTSIMSILTSGLAFFAAVLGVALYSRIDLLSSLCLLLARGALISMSVVILVLPAMLMIFDKLICHTTIDLRRTVLKGIAKK